MKTLIEYLNKGTLETTILVFCRNSKVFYANIVVEDSKPNSWYSFSLEEPLYAPVIAKAEFY